MKINAPITLNDRERQLIKRLTNKLPRISVTWSPPEEDQETKETEKAEDERSAVRAFFDGVVGKKPKVYPY